HAAPATAEGPGSGQRLRTKRRENSIEPLVSAPQYPSRIVYCGHIGLCWKRLIRVVGQRLEPALRDNGDVIDGEPNGRPTGSWLGRILFRRELATRLEHLVVGPAIECEQRNKVVLHGKYLLRWDGVFLYTRGLGMASCRETAAKPLATHLPCPVQSEQFHQGGYSVGGNFIVYLACGSFLLSSSFAKDKTAQEQERVRIAPASGGVELQEINIVRRTALGAVKEADLTNME